MIAGLLVQSATIGQLLILMYGIFAFIYHIESQTTFTLALVAVMTTIALFMFRNNPTLANNFSMYAFLLLIVGVVSLARETRQLQSLHTRRRNKK